MIKRGKKKLFKKKKKKHLKHTLITSLYNPCLILYQGNGISIIGTLICILINTYFQLINFVQSLHLQCNCC